MDDGVNLRSTGHPRLEGATYLNGPVDPGGGSEVVSMRPYPWSPVQSQAAARAAAISCLTVAFFILLT